MARAHKQKLSLTYRQLVLHIIRFKTQNSNDDDPNSRKIPLGLFF